MKRDMFFITTFIILFLLLIRLMKLGILKLPTLDNQ